MSTYTDIVDGTITDLRTNVAALGTVVVHKYTPMSPEFLTADGKKHLACWPVGETAAEESYGLATLSLGISQRYQLCYWEPSDEAEFGVADEEKAATFLALVEAIRARFIPDVSRGGAWMLRWRAATFGLGGTQEDGLVRFLLAEFSADVAY